MRYECNPYRNASNKKATALLFICTWHCTSTPYCLYSTLKLRENLSTYLTKCIENSVNFISCIQQIWKIDLVWYVQNLPNGIKQKYYPGPRSIEYFQTSERACSLVVTRTSVAPQILGSTPYRSEYSRI